jgi:hypothetical protein
VHREENIIKIMDTWFNFAHNFLLDPQPHSENLFSSLTECIHIFKFSFILNTNYWIIKVVFNFKKLGDPSSLDQVDINENFWVSLQQKTPFSSC